MDLKDINGLGYKDWPHSRINIWAKDRTNKETLYFCSEEREGIDVPYVGSEGLRSIGLDIRCFRNTGRPIVIVNNPPKKLLRSNKETINLIINGIPRPLTLEELEELNSVLYDNPPRLRLVA